MINKYKHIVYFLLVNSLTFGFGQSMQELNKLRADYEKLKKGQVQTQVPGEATETIDPATGLPRQAQIFPYEPIDEERVSSEESSKHFGYDFFTRRDSIAFWENLPTPANYLLGPGDELIVSLWGETQLRETYTISREGKIYDEKVGILVLSGNTIYEAKQYLKSQFGRVYATLNGRSPSTFMDVSLGELRSINVNFVGQVKYPGVYPIHPFSTVITGLIQAGGVDTTGSLRKIKIKRDEKLLNTVDLYDYFLEGSISANIQLRDQDIVVVPPRTSVITIDSAIVKEGIYEGLPGETVFDLIQYAGGLTHDASGTIGVRRVKSRDRRKNGIVHEAHYLDIDNAKLIPAQSGDQISVRHLLYEFQQVIIIGQVKVPGIYHYYEGMTLNELIALGGGFNDSTFWKSVYHDQAEIIRRSPKSRYDEVIPVDLNDVFINGKDVPLQNLDRVVIHANVNYFEKDHVQILGEVNVPGSYPLIMDNESLQSIIDRIGGYTSQAMKDGISIYRKKKYFSSDVNDAKDDTSMVRVAWQNESVTLMPGDSIVVKESPGAVNITGHVYNPGLIEFRRGKGLNYYIDAAGGVTEEGNKKNIIVVYANGVVSPKKFLSSPKIEDGATIIINEKPSSEPFDPTEFASTTLSLLSSLVTILVLSQQL